MQRRISSFRIVGMITVLIAAGTVLSSATAQKASVPRPQDNLAMGESQVRQLLLLMPTDKKGMVSRQEYMNFMEAEFDRLDKGKKANWTPENWGNQTFPPAATSGDKVD